MPNDSHSRFLPPGMTRDCFDPWTYVEVHPHGGISPCCVRRPVGNVSEQSLAEILNGPRIRELRRALLSGEPDETCQGCGLRKVTDPATLQAKVGVILATIRIPVQFDADRYLEANPDVRAAGESPSRHFVTWGRLEGRPLETTQRLPPAGVETLNGPPITAPAQQTAQNQSKVPMEFADEIPTTAVTARCATPLAAQ